MTQTKIPSKKELERRHRAAFDYLDENYAYFVTNLVRLGSPRWTNAIPTAAVAVLDDAGDKMEFEYLFNPEFAASLDAEKLAFVYAHESMHILLNHLKLVNNYLDKKRYNEIRQKIEKRQTLDRQERIDSIKFQQIARKFNIAADCVINDYLAQAGLPIWEQACTGEKFIGEDAAFMTVNDVYERLPETNVEMDPNGLGSGMGEGGVDSHDWMFDPDFAEKIADAIDKMNEEIEKNGSGVPSDLQDKREEEAGNETQAQKDLRNSMRAGSEEGNIREFQEVHGLGMAWVKLLKEVDPDMFKEPGFAPPPKAAWHKKPRKLGARQFTEINLPVYQKNPRDEKRSNEKPAIVLALDYSGSIGPGDADRFATLARSIPQERIKVFACTFTTSYRVFDIDNPHGGGSGGTSFDPINDFINNEVAAELKGKYPKAVIVITDGEATFSRTQVSEEEAKSWLWLMSPDRTGHYSYGQGPNTVGRKQMLKDYIV